MHSTSPPPGPVRGAAVPTQLDGLRVVRRPPLPSHSLTGRHVLLAGPDAGRDRIDAALHTDGLAEHLAAVAGSVTVRRCAPPGSGGLGRAGSLTLFGTAALGGPLPRVPDLVVAVLPGLAAAAAAARIAHRHRAPLILVVHDLVTARPSGRYSCRGVRVAEATERRLLARASEVAVVSADLDVVVRTLGVPAERVHLLPQWSARPASAIDRLAARRALGWPVRPFTVVCPLSSDGRQDTRTVAEAARLLGRTADVVLVSDPAGRTIPRARTAQEPGVRFATALDDDTRRRMLGAADLLLLAQRPDTQGPAVPLSLVECLAAGRPIVAAAPQDSAVPAELDRTGGAGLVVPPGDPVVLAAAVRALSLDDEVRVAMGLAGLQYAADRLDRRRAMHRLDRIVEAALTRGPSAP